MTNQVDLEDFLTRRGYPLLKRLVIVNAFRPATIVNDIAFVSSATPLQFDGKEVTGKVGSEVDIRVAQRAACLCLSHSLSLLRLAIGEPLGERILRAVDLTFFINADPDFCEHSEIADEASRLLIDGLGTRGEHSRSAIGVGSLVRNVSVVLKATYQVEP
jgi:enamine deaminase RidA (YjgF/YER057c/UK114 family)